MTGFQPSRTEVRAAREAAGTPAPAPQSLDIPEIPREDVFLAVSVPSGDLVSNGRTVKFFIDLRSGAPKVHFVNANYQEGGQVPEKAKFHFDFAKTLNIPESLDEFNQITYFREPKKKYVAGVVHTYFMDGAATPIYGLQFYPQDVVREGGVVDALTPVVKQLSIPQARFAFVPTGQQQTTAGVTAALKAAGLEVIPLERILGSIVYLPLNAGESWGYLRVFPKNSDDLTPMDIPVFDELPLDLSVVAGCITKAVQDSSSHVNLKSKERGTPNMVLRDAGPSQPRLEPFLNKPIHFVVRADGFLLEETTDQVIRQKLAERNNRPWIPLHWKAEKRLLTYDEMAAAGADAALGMSSRFGTKAANLGFLCHPGVLGRAAQTGTLSARLKTDLVPFGFAVPFTFYDRFIRYPPNVSVRKAIAELIKEEKAGTLSSTARAALVEKVQSSILDAQFPPDDLAAVRLRLSSALPGVTKVKVRSSANAEDVPNFDGAGLHDSFSATVDKPDEPHGSCRFEEDASGGADVKRKVKPKTVACAIKGVYASLWNKRAIEERSFARIDHSTVAMGLAIVPAYDLESEVAANAVVITRVLNTTGVYGYTLSVQEGNNLVTNPDPGTHSEITIAALGTGDEPTSLTITRYAKPAQSGPVKTQPVLTPDQMKQLIDISVQTERAYCRFKQGYYPGSCEFVVVDNEKPTSLDLELKLLKGGNFVCKQVREFGGK